MWMNRQRRWGWIYTREKIIDRTGCLVTERCLDESQRIWEGVRETGWVTCFWSTSRKKETMNENAGRNVSLLILIWDRSMANLLEGWKQELLKTSWSRGNTWKNHHRTWLLVLVYRLVNLKGMKSSSIPVCLNLKKFFCWTFLCLP